MSKDPRADVIAKALKDPAFRAELLKNPGAAISKATGVKLPPGITIKVVEDGGSTVHLVLPPAVAAGELSADDLSKVAGGASGTPTKPDYCYNACTDAPIQCIVAGLKSQ